MHAECTIDDVHLRWNRVLYYTPGEIVRLNLTRPVVMDDSGSLRLPDDVTVVSASGTRVYVPQFTAKPFRAGVSHPYCEHEELCNPEMVYTW